MTAQDALKAVLREVVGPVVRGGGFQRSGATWRAVNSLNDVAVVNVQSSSWSSATSLRCVINVAVAPAPWREWTSTWVTRTPKSINESAGLFRDRLHPTGTPAGSDGWWEISSSDDADAAAQDMAMQLNNHGLPLLTGLLDRSRMLESIRAGDLGHMKKTSQPVFFARAEAVLIADEGPRERLDELLSFARLNTMPSQQDNARAFDAWIRQRAERPNSDTA